MRQLRIVLSAFVVVGISPSVWAADPSLRECTKVTHVKSGAGLTTLSSKNSKVCAVTCLATTALGTVAVYDSPTASTTHGQAVVVWEEGAAVAGDSHSAPHLALYTNYGLYVDADRCDATVAWVD